MTLQRNGYTIGLRQGVSFMCKKLIFVLLVWFLELTICFADEDNLQAEVDAYNKADYQQVVNIGKKVIAEQPENEMARYYLANAYSHLDLMSEAIKQYNFCTTMAGDPMIRSYAKQALAVLNSQNNNSAASSSNQWVNMAHFAGSQGSNAYQMNAGEVNQDMRIV